MSAKGKSVEASISTDAEGRISAAYISLVAAPLGEVTLEIDGAQLFLDRGPDGRILGIEIIFTKPIPVAG